MRLIGFAIYLGIGAMLHAIFIGATFDWTSAWTFGWLLGWPIMLFAAFWGAVLMLTVVVVICVVIYFWFEMIANWWDVRKRRHLR